MEPQTIKTGSAWLDHHRKLSAGLRDMIRGGRLNQADIPDDWGWLIKMLTWTPENEHTEDQTP